MTANPNILRPQEDSNNEKGPEDMTAEELISKMYELGDKASDAFRHGRDEEEVERIDVEIEKYSDAFMKLTGRTPTEYRAGGKNPLEAMNEEELKNQIIVLEKELKSFKLDKTYNQFIEERMRVYGEAYKNLTGKEWSE